MPAQERASPPEPRAPVCRAAAAVWDFVFGAPRVRDLPDGGVTVRLLGRRFDASSRAALFDQIGRDRERLLAGVARMHESAATRPFLGANRVIDSYHRDAQRIEDRVAIYSEFLARLGRELDQER